MFPNYGATGKENHEWCCDNSWRESQVQFCIKYKDWFFFFVLRYLNQNIETYLIEKNADKAILEERERNIGGLTESTRRFLIGHLADYAVAVFGLNVTWSQLVPFCKAVVALFPSLNLGNDKIVNVVSSLITYILSDSCTLWCKLWLYHFK